MKYTYTFRNSASDYWKYYMGNTYHSMMAVVNVIFTVAMVILIYAKWDATNGLGKGLMVLGALLFPVLQPLAIYLRSARESSAIKEETTLSFEDDGLHIRVKQHNQKILWRDYYCLVKRDGYLLAIPDGKHAYILTKRILGQDMKALYQDVTEKINQYSNHKDENDRVNGR